MHFGHGHTELHHVGHRPQEPHRPASAKTEEHCHMIISILAVLLFCSGQYCVARARGVWPSQSSSPKGNCLLHRRLLERMGLGRCGESLAVLCSLESRALPAKEPDTDVIRRASKDAHFLFLVDTFRAGLRCRGILLEASRSSQKSLLDAVCSYGFARTSVPPAWCVETDFAKRSSNSKYRRIACSPDDTSCPRFAEQRVVLEPTRLWPPKECGSL